MKNLNQFLIILIIGFLLLIGCSFGDQWMEYTFKIENFESYNQDELKKLKSFMSNRLGTLGFAKSETSLSDGNLIIDVLINLEKPREVAYFKTIFESHEVELCNTYRTDDQTIMKIDIDSIEVENFRLYTKLNRYYPNEVLGISPEQSNHKSIRDELLIKTNNMADLSLNWSNGTKDNLDEGVQHYELYLVKKNLDRSSKITDYDIMYTDVIEDKEKPDTYNLVIGLTESASSKFELMSKEAAKNNRNIALILDDEVIFSARVTEPILDGRIYNTINLAKNEAEELSRKLRVGRMEYSFNLINEQISKKR